MPSVIKTATVDEVMSSEPVDAAPVAVPEALAEKPPVPAAPKPFVPSALETASTEPFVPSVIKTATVDEVMSSESTCEQPVHSSVVESPVSTGVAKAMSVEDVMGDAGFTDEPPSEPVKDSEKTTKEKPIAAASFIPVSTGVAKAMSVEDVMGDAGFTDEPPSEPVKDSEKTTKEKPIAAASFIPVSTGVAKAMSVEDVMGDAGFTDEPPSEPVKTVEKPASAPSVAIKVKREIKKVDLPGDLKELLGKIKGYAQFAGKLEIDPMLRWSAFSYLNRLTSSIRRVFPEAPSFARQVALHKLEVLEQFTSDYGESDNLERYFNDVFVSMSNVGVIDSFNVFRSSQPSVRDLDWAINQLGVKVIVNLCHENQVWLGYTLEEEKDVCNEFVVDYFHFPLENWDDPSITPEKVKEILNVIDFHAKPILVHSSNGADRVGVVAAVYRMTYLGWSLEEALTEAKRFGFDNLDRPNNVKLIESFAR